jgi:hypothetical protein
MELARRVELAGEVAVVGDARVEPLDLIRRMEEDLAPVRPRAEGCERTLDLGQQGTHRTLVVQPREVEPAVQSEPTASQPK